MWDEGWALGPEVPQEDRDRTWGRWLRGVAKDRGT